MTGERYSAPPPRAQAGAADNVQGQQGGDGEAMVRNSASPPRRDPGAKPESAEDRGDAADARAKAHEKNDGQLNGRSESQEKVPDDALSAVPTVTAPNPGDVEGAAETGAPRVSAAAPPRAPARSLRPKSPGASMPPGGAGPFAQSEAEDAPTQVKHSVNDSSEAGTFEASGTLAGQPKAPPAPPKTLRPQPSTPRLLRSSTPRSSLAPSLPPALPPGAQSPAAGKSPALANEEKAVVKSTTESAGAADDARHAPSASAPPPTPAVVGSEGAGTAESLEANPNATGTHRERGMRLIRQLKLTLEAETNPKRCARLHFELAMQFEMALRDDQSAASHYESALKHFSELIPAIRGLRRLHIRARRYHDALSLFDAEARLLSDVKDKGTCYLLKGRLLADQLGEHKRAASEYTKAIELDSTALTNLKALEGYQHRQGEWSALSHTFERQSNLIADDPLLRSAIIERRALLVERQLHHTDESIELYELALKLNHDTPRALASLKRLHQGQRRWHDLIRLLHLEAELASDDSVKVMAFYGVARIHSERLGNLQDAVSALEKAVQLAPQDTLILDELARLYEVTDRHDALVVVLQLLVEVLASTDERLALLHRMGQVYEDRLNQDESATFCFEAALALVPTYGPALQALGKLYSRQQNWKGLIQMHLGEAEHAEDPQTRATAYVRIAEIHERHLAEVPRAIEFNRRALTVVADHQTAFKNLSRLLSATEDWRHLLELYELALERTNERAPRMALLLKIAQIYEDNLHDYESAVRTYQRVLVVDGNHLVAIQAVQRTAERAERYQEMVEALELEASLVENKAARVALLQRAAEVFDERIGDREGAVARFSLVIDLDPSYRPALSGLGRVYYRSGRWNDLLEVHRLELRAAVNRTERLNLLFHMAELSEKRLGDEAQALDFYREAVTEDPAFKPALRALTTCLIGLEKWDEVPALLKLEFKALDASSEKARSAFRLGEVYEEHLNDLVKAEAAYALALEVHGGYRPALDALLRLHAQRGEWRKYVNILERELEDCHDNRQAVSALVRQADVLAGPLTSPLEGIARLERARQIATDQLSVLCSLEELYRRLEQHDNLATTYQRIKLATEHLGAQVASLKEFARIRRLETSPDPDEYRRTFIEVLAREEGDFEALEALEALALSLEDRAALIQVDQALSEREDEPVTAAVYHARLGDGLECLGQPHAIDAYRAAIRHDSDNYGAVCGFARLAATQGEPDLLSEAARRQAALTRDSAEAAELLLASARIRESGLGDRAGAQDDLERALEFKPGHEAVAEELSRLLCEAERYAELADILTNAAASATTSARAVALWKQIASLKAEQLGDRPTAIACLRRALRLAPDDAPTLLTLAQLYQEDSQPIEAVKLIRLLSQLPDAAIDKDGRVDAYLRLFELYNNVLRQPKEALEQLKHALQVDDAHTEALEAMARFQLAHGRGDEALATLERLTASLHDQPPKRVAEALLSIASIHWASGRDAAGNEALGKALSLAGPTEDIFEAVMARKSDTRLVKLAIRALQNYLKEAVGTDFGDGVLRLAQLYADAGGHVEHAIATLMQAVELGGPRQNSVRAALALYLREDGKGSLAVEQYQALIERQPFDVNIWRALAQTYQQNQQPREMRLALQAIKALGQIEQAEQDELAVESSSLDLCQPGSLNANFLHEIARFGEREAVAVSMIALLSPALPKLYPPDLEAYGVTSRDRVASRTDVPLRDIADRICAILGIPDLEFYLHRVRLRGVAVELGQPPLLMVPSNLGERPVGRQVFLLARPPDLGERPFARQLFLLARPLVLMAQELHALEKLTPRELEVLLASAARTVKPSFGAGLTSEDFLDEQNRRIGRALARRQRKLLEESSSAYVQGARVDIAHLTAWIIRNASNVAAVICGDLNAALSSLEQLDGRSAPETNITDSPVAADLLRFWCSDTAMRLRKRLGVLN